MDSPLHGRLDHGPQFPRLAGRGVRRAASPRRAPALTEYTSRYPEAPTRSAGCSPCPAADGKLKPASSDATGSSLLSAPSPRTQEQLGKPCNLPRDSLFSRVVSGTVTVYESRVCLSGGAHRAPERSGEYQYLCRAILDNLLDRRRRCGEAGLARDPAGTGRVVPGLLVSCVRVPPAARP